MDDKGLLLRKNKKLKTDDVLDQLTLSEKEEYFDRNEVNGKWLWKKHLGKEEKEQVENTVFFRLNYDDQLTYCRRPEQVEGPSPKAWKEINVHLKTNATSLQELVEVLGQREFGRTPRVGDAFAGGGSIPFEAARIGCEAYASDLNPAAALLTWASLNIIGGGKEVQEKVEKAQQDAFAKANRQITEWGIEHNEKGWRADAYLYCVEAKSPATGYWVPLAPSWVISEKYKVCGVLKPDHENKRYNVEIITNADAETFKKAKEGTVKSGSLVCPETGHETPISTIRGDKKINGKTQYGLRQWENNDLVPQPEDTFQERLYCIRYIETFYTARKDFSSGGEIWKKGAELSKTEGESLKDFKDLLNAKTMKLETRRQYVEPDAADLRREEKVLELLEERFKEWQKNGYIPSKQIARGYNTEQPVRERGWTHWHHLFNPRQLLINGLIGLQVDENTTDKQSTRCLLLLSPRLANLNSRICRWLQTQGGGIGGGKETFDNMALNTLYNYSTRSFRTLLSAEISLTSLEEETKNGKVVTSDARVVETFNDIWITDPPYADAINYHELGDFFLAWYEKRIPTLFPEWYNESKAALAVKGSGQSFNQSMVECYSNFTTHMPNNGTQVVMFTHQDSSVWADLALVLWASGLQVTAAWTIQTETSSALKTGNYVQGTVIMVLRKQSSEEIGFLSDIQADVEHEVKEQLKFMTGVDDKDDPNFGDADYQLAAYAAALRVLTGYKSIEDIDVNYELGRQRKKGEENEVEKIIQSAVRVAMDYLVPGGFEEHYWRKLHPEERFYLKGLEVEKHGEYRNGVYQEMARGFGLREYKHMLNSGKANMTRLRTPIEFKNRELGNEGFGSSLTRNILFAIYETQKTEDPRMGRNWLHNELKDYWGNRQLILHILRYIGLNAQPIEHWKNDVEALELLKGFVENDSV